MSRNATLILIAAVLVSVGVYFFLSSETAVEDPSAITAAEPAVPPAPSAVGDTAVPETAPAEPAPQELIPSNE